MSSKQPNLLQGTLDLLVLKALGLANFTGWASHAALSRLHEAHFSSNLARSSQLFIAWRKRAG